MKRLLMVFLFATLAAPTPSQTSDLWGANGERWNPRSRLPDFSYAGYHSGEAPLPQAPRGVSVKQFGAKGDGTTDDTAAFQKALASVKRGAIEIPPGRYRITDILEISQSHVVLSGAGPDKSVLFFPKQLNDIKPNWGETTAGRPTSNYSWSGGFLGFKGNLGLRPLATIIGTARRGDTTVRVSNTKNLSVGQRVEILETDTSENSLADLLYSGDAGDTRKLLGTTRASIVCHILKITDDKNLELDRALRFDIKPEWHPRLVSFEPTVSESGVEDLGFEFPVTPYRGHFTELGFNAVAFVGVADCWAFNLRIANADSGIFTNSYFCTISRVLFESARAPDATGSTGHHGFDFEGEDNLFTDFDFRAQFIHDITVDHNASGNVSAHGRGADLSLDHHRRAVNENLYTDIDAGAGTRLWLSSGGDALGKHAAARNTFWNIRARRPQNYPPADFGPPSINLIAVETKQSSEKDLNAKWFEAIPPDQIVPQDIHAAQLARRLHNAKVKGQR